MITIQHRGSFRKMERFLNKMKGQGYLNALAEYGDMGVEALRSNTPVDSGKTSESWTYEIERNDTTTRISWINTNTNQNVNIAIILQYGHGTGTGGDVEGIDYINPALKPIFDYIAEGVWREVTSA